MNNAGRVTNGNSKLTGCSMIQDTNAQNPMG